MATSALRSGIAAAIVVAATAADAQPPVTTVREAGGEYTVAATFTVPAPARIVHQVLTDYANIPRFMPDVRRSVVIERRDGHARVEQEATPQFMWFSKQISLVLDIEEGTEALTFHDRGNTSFTRYEGSWRLAPGSDRTQVSYQLVARPAFSVPGFVLRKLLKRDAVTMIDRLTAEIRARAADE